MLSTQILLLRVLPYSGSQFYPGKGREMAAATRQLSGLGAGIPGTLLALPKCRSPPPLPVSLAVRGSQLCGRLNKVLGGSWRKRRDSVVPSWAVVFKPGSGDQIYQHHLGT